METIKSTRKISVAIILLAFLCHQAWAKTVPPRKSIFPNTGLQVRQRGFYPFDVSLNDRANCSDGEPVGEQPVNRHNTTERVSDLIQGMEGRLYDAYVVPSADAHQSEYVSAADERRAYISGFTGSAGTAVILASGSRALWTDGRYFLQAEEQLDCTWLLMKDGNDGVPTISEWLISELESGATVSADARLVGAETWINFESDLVANGINLVVDEINDGNNLLDEQWNDDGRPSYSTDPIFVLEIQFAGKEWFDKIADIQEEMSSYGAQVFVISMLDENAWTLNLRGSDIAYNPVFRSYIIIDQSGEGSGSSNVSLFVPDIDLKVPDEVIEALNIGNCIPDLPCVSLVPYDDIGSALSNLTAQSEVTSVMIPSQFSTSEGASYYIYSLIPDEKRLLHPSPPLLMKAMKNPVEVAGMKNAHVKDAVAVISWLYFMEDTISMGAYWTEISAMDELAAFRYEQEDNMGLSFGTISAFGPNGAIIHYEPSPETNLQITNASLYLVDSGGQYKDGTTDITRTLHYGTPTAEQIEAYTRVLIGVIDFANIVFPKDTGKYDTDILARRSLYSVGLDYNHGTSHGVGMFLNVHEASDVVYELGFHGSDEPGYYEDGAWGIRIENVISIVNVTTKYNFVEESYGPETITMVPYEPKLIDITLLSEAQCEFLNDYNAQVREIAGAELLNQNKTSEYNWMLSKTENYTCS